MTKLSQAQAGASRMVGTIPGAVRGPVGRDSTKLAEKIRPGVELRRPGRDRPTMLTWGAHGAGTCMRGALRRTGASRGDSGEALPSKDG